MLFERAESFFDIYNAFETLKTNFFTVPADYEGFVKKIHKYGVCIVAKSDKTEGLIAFYANNYETKTAFITSVLVSSESRGKGIGSGLVEACENICRENGFEKITLEVHSDNSIAISLYEKFGYKPYKTDGESIYMEKIIV